MVGPTCIGPGDAVQRAARDADDLLALQRRDAPRAAHVVVRAVTQTVVVALTPAKQTRGVNHLVTLHKHQVTK